MVIRDILSESNERKIFREKYRFINNNGYIEFPFNLLICVSLIIDYIILIREK